MLNPATVRRRRQPPTTRRVRLPDGARISIRPIRAADAEAFVRAYACLSERSRERRYLSLAPELRPAEVRYLTSVDQNEHVALVALNDSREILASARYIRIPTRPSVAEMAIEVIDDWQRRGVGRALLEALSQHAQDAGVARFVAIVSTENVPMQRILTCARASSEKVDGELEYTVYAAALTAPDRRRQRRSARSPGVADELPLLLGANPWNAGPLAVRH